MTEKQMLGTAVEEKGAVHGQTGINPNAVFISGEKPTTTSKKQKC